MRTSKAPERSLALSPPARIAMLTRRSFVSSLALPFAALTGCRARPEANAPTENPADRFRFPGEWHPHERTLMAMPPPEVWENTRISIDQVRRQWSTVANVLQEFEPVTLVVRPEDRKACEPLLDSSIELLELPLDDGWTRDSGPLIVINERGERRVAGFRFNGWGDKFPHGEDALLKKRLAEHLELPFDPIDLVLEGGAIHCDGEGTLITTRPCILNDNRNPGVTQAEVEELLAENLGVGKVIWIDGGLEPDPITDGHIDGLCAFVQPGVVLLHSAPTGSRNAKVCVDAKRVLENTTDARGRKIEVIDLPLTGALPHMNFYLGNGCVLVPTNGEPKLDDAPLGVLRETFFDREVVGVDARILDVGGGGIHCITQQVPMPSGG